MDLDAFSSLPDEAQLWVYGFAKPLGEAERGLIGGTLDQFLTEWSTHGTPVRGAYSFAGDRFVILAGHLEGGISGCSIDSSVRSFQRLRDAHGLDGLDRSLIHFRDANGDLRSVAFNEFQERVAAGEVGPDTEVFDTTIQTLADLRAGRFQLPFAESWHARSFPLPTAYSGSRTRQ